MDTCFFILQGVPEDLLFFYEHLRKGGGVVRVDQSLLLYRYHPGAATHSVLEYVVLGSRLGGVGGPSQVSAPRWGPGSVADTRAHGLPGGRSSPVCGPAFSSGSRLSVCSHFYYLFQLLWVFVAAQAVSSCSEQGLLSSFGVQASHYGGFLLFQSMGSQHTGFMSCSAWAHLSQHMGLAVLKHVGSPGTRDRTYVPCISRWILSP